MIILKRIRNFVSTILPIKHNTIFKKNVAALKICYSPLFAAGVHRSHNGNLEELHFSVSLRQFVGDDR